MLGNFKYSNPTKLYFGRGFIKQFERGTGRLWKECTACLWWRFYQEKWYL